MGCGCVQDNIAAATMSIFKKFNNPFADFNDSQIKKVIYLVIMCVCICSACMLCLITESYLLRNEEFIEKGRMIYVSLFSIGGTLLALLFLHVLCPGDDDNHHHQSYKKHSGDISKFVNNGATIVELQDLRPVELEAFTHPHEGEDDFQKVELSSATTKL